MSVNLAQEAECSRIKKTFSNGLSSYTQTHCKCTLTDIGYRIYRTPNVNPTDNGNTMWGGFVLDNTNNRFGFTKTHTYILQFEVKGQSSNSATDLGWNNLVGWSGGGLTPAPSNVLSANPVKANYQNDNWETYTYRWTINDDVYKVCTKSYSSFVEGQTYLSYKGFKYGFSYTNTGALGTDLYIRNIRLYDITDGNKRNISKQGIVNVNDIVEENRKAEVTYGSIVCETLIED